MLSTVQQMQTYVLVHLNKANQGTVTPPEFDVLINGAMMQWVKNAYQALETDQKAMDSLRILMPPPLVIANTGSAAPQQEVFEMPYVAAPAPGQHHGYLYLLNAAVHLFTNVGGIATAVACRSDDGWAMARPLRRNARNEVVRRPFSRPSDERPYYMLTGNQARILAGANSFAAQMRIEYLRHPARISVVSNAQPELPPAVNQEIADLAVRQKLQITADPRHQTRLMEDRMKA